MTVFIWWAGRPGSPGLSDLPKVIAELVTESVVLSRCTVQVAGSNEKQQFNICRGTVVIIRVMAWGHFLHQYYFKHSRKKNYKLCSTLTLSRMSHKPEHLGIIWCFPAGFSLQCYLVPEYIILKAEPRKSLWIVCYDLFKWEASLWREIPQSIVQNYQLMPSR